MKEITERLRELKEEQAWLSERVANSSEKLQDAMDRYKKYLTEDFNSEMKGDRPKRSAEIFNAEMDEKMYTEHMIAEETSLKYIEREIMFLEDLSRKLG